MIAAEAARTHGPCCWRTNCREGRCSVTLPRSGAKKIMCGTSYQTNHRFEEKLCDCILFWDADAKHSVCVIELKAGAPNIGHVAQQLQNGARIAEGLVATCQGVEFFPLLACGSMTAAEMRVWERRRIRFRNKRYRIIKMNCGDDVATVLESVR